MEDKTFEQILSEVSIEYEQTEVDKRFFCLDTPMNHYWVKLTRGNKVLEVPFSMGLGHKEGPDKKGVLYCLVMDALTYECTPDYKEYMSDFGMDIYDVKEIKKAKRIVKACKKLYESLSSDFCTWSEYETLKEGYQDY